MSINKVLRITDEERKAIRKTYDRTDKQIEEDIQSLKEWLKKQPHLPQDEEDMRLRMMLYYNKFSLEKTKTKIDMYYSIKNIAPEFYLNREPMNPQMSKHMDDVLMFPLPNLTPELHRVYMIKFLDKDSTKFNMNVYLKVIFGTFDLRLVADASIGDRFIMDMGNITLGHIVQFTPVAIKKSYDVLQKAYSDQIKGVHFLNMPPYAGTLVSLINSILSEKLANRVFAHKDYNELKEIVSEKVLPNEYGGTAGPLMDIYDDWKKYFKSQNDYLKKLGDKKSNEKKRIGEPFDSEMFGVGGSFRKLSFD